MTKLGVIADDFTGATDIASFMANAGWKVVLFNGVPDEAYDDDSHDAIVIALKSRSIPASEAITQSLAASEWFKAHGCERQFFKYCSTFDSTDSGNIGPVTDALMASLNTSMTILCPAVPDNGRTIVHGHLFVKGQLLNECGMQHHPVIPMNNACLKVLMEAQSNGICGLISLDDVQNYKETLPEILHSLRSEKVNYVIFDVLNNDDLLTAARITSDFPFVTGGAGLGWAIAKLDTESREEWDNQINIESAGYSVILSGSCSSMTNQQVDFYKQRASSLALEVEKIIQQDDYLQEVAEWVINHSGNALAPLVYATQPSYITEAIQKQYGSEYVSERIERFFSDLARCLSNRGFNKFIVAGGETSGAVIQGLNVRGMIIGHDVAPGVPWTQVLDQQKWVILKSGNFGSSDFFLKAQESFHG